MAGDWIKMRGNLWDDPRVSKLCDLTGQSEASVVGGLYWLWAAADQHTETGVMMGLSTRQIDRKTGVQGLGQALIDIGWIADHPEGIRIVRFEEHNGASSKKRLETAKRVSNHRAAKTEVTLEENEQGDYKRLSIPSAVKKTVIDRDGNCCVYCGRKGGDLGPMETKADGYIHLDHVIPLAQNGANDESNLVASCRKCNMTKGARTPEEAGMNWPVINGKRIGNKNALHIENESVTGALAREEKRREDILNTIVGSKLPDCPHEKILALYAKHLPQLAQPRVWEGNRQEMLRARWRWVLTSVNPSGQPYATDAESALDFFDRLFRYINKCPFLLGENKTEWTADLAWLVKAENFAKVLEGKYEAKGVTA